MLLDLNVGALTVYKNRKRLGVMIASGLNHHGVLEWAVELRFPGDQVHVRRQPPPGDYIPPPKPKAFRSMHP